MSRDRDATEPPRQETDAWSAGESAENGEVIATKPGDVTRAADEAEVQEGGDVRDGN